MALPPPAQSIAATQARPSGENGCTTNGPRVALDPRFCRVEPARLLLDFLPVSKKQSSKLDSTKKAVRGAR